MLIMPLTPNAENKDLYFNEWSRRDRKSSLQSYHPIMKSRGKMFQLHERYYPGIMILEIPPWFEGVISVEYWKASLRKFNDVLFEWWRPGDRVRNHSLFLSFLCLPLMCCICALDETTARKKTQCINAMKPICEKFTEETPLKWSVDFIHEENELMISRDLSVVGIELSLSLKNPKDGAN